MLDSPKNVLRTRSISFAYSLQVINPISGETMKRFICIAVLLCAVLAKPTLAQDQFQGIRDSIRSKMVEREVPSLALAVAQNGHILWEEGFGWADRERMVPADANTMYSLASISKPLTATALMTLVEAKKIDLDKPINNYLGPAKLRARVGSSDDATVRRVANHSSGLPEYFQFFYDNEALRAPSRNETILRFGNLVAAPGERFQYSNLGYGILDDVISRVSDETFADYMRKAVFLKLGMTRTAVGRDAALGRFEATRYDGEDLTPIAYYQTDHPGASEIYSSAHDMALFGMFSLKAHLATQAPILTDASIDAMQEPTIFSRPGVGYGIGWEKDTTSGVTVISHSGGMPGVATWLRLFPNQQLVIVVLCNEDDRLAHIIADEITQKLVPNWKVPVATATSSNPQTTDLAGLRGRWQGSVETYRSSALLTLDALGEEVRIQLGSQPVTILDHASFVNGILRGSFRGEIDLPEAARRPYILSLNLRLRDGKVLNGSITARAEGSGTVPLYTAHATECSDEPSRTIRAEREAFLLSQWTELRKQ